MGVAVKICGLTDEKSVQSVIAAGADYAGFVYFPASPRHLSPERAHVLAKLLPASVRSVSVLVDPEDALLDRIQLIVGPAYVQLHGKESPERVRQINDAYPFKVIKALSIHNREDIALAQAYADSADMLMFDAKPPENAALPGGNGLSFDWSLLHGQDISLPWFLSGGLAPDNVAAALAASGARMVDVSSGVERAPGVKDAALIESFVKAAKA